MGAHKRRQKAATKSGERARVLCARRRKPGQRHPASAARRKRQRSGARPAQRSKPGGSRAADLRPPVAGDRLASSQKWDANPAAAGEGGR